VPRLRTSLTLSALALAGGIAGTAWLSTLTAVWPGAPARYTMQHAMPASHRAHRPARVVRAHRAPPLPMPAPVVAHDEAPAPAVAAPATLVPLATPADTSQPWYRLRGHMDGRVVMRVSTDASGHVARASVATSSGDPVLDAHALRSVLAWRFAVPPDHPAGITGELPLRFSSAAL